MISKKTSTIVVHATPNVQKEQVVLMESADVYLDKQAAMKLVHHSITIQKTVVNVAINAPETFSVLVFNVLQNVPKVKSLVAIDVQMYQMIQPIVDSVTKPAKMV